MTEFKFPPLPRALPQNRLRLEIRKRIRFADKLGLIKKPCQKISAK